MPPKSKKTVAPPPQSAAVRTREVPFIPGDIVTVGELPNRSFRIVSGCVNGVVRFLDGTDSLVGNVTLHRKANEGANPLLSAVKTMPKPAVSPNVGINDSGKMASDPPKDRVLAKTGPEWSTVPAPDLSQNVVKEIPKRTIKVSEWDGTAGLIVITEGGESDIYAIRRMTMGPVQFTKLRNTEAGMFLAPPRTVTGHTRCDCPGFVNHGKCRHCEAVTFFVSTNRL